MTEEEIVKCYGTKRIKDGEDQCELRSECPFGEACLSRANEEASAIHYHKAHVSVGFMLYDPTAQGDDDDDDDGGESKPVTTYKSPSEAAEAEAEREVMMFDSTPLAESNDVVLGDTVIPGGEYEIVCEAMEKIADLYFNYPTSFDCLMKSVYKGMSQSDVAREKDITRQWLNKRLLYELGIAQKRNDAQQRRDREVETAKREYGEKVEQLRQQTTFFGGLSERDWKIYKLAFVDGCSRESVAKQLGIGSATVSRVIQFIRENCTTPYTIKRGRKPKKRKNE